MFRLMADVATGAKWAGEDARLGLLLSRRAASAGAGVSQNGLSYAKGLANASIDPVAALDYRTAGLPHVALLQRLAREKEAGVEEVSAALAEIAAFALARNRVMRCRISAKPEACDPAVKQMEAFIDALPPRGADAVGDELTLAQSLASFSGAPSKTFVATPTQTNYCAASYLTVPYSHPDSAPLFLLGQAMSTSFLHREIREKGGAYGGGASAAPVEGVFVFSSYRDPNTTATETFEKGRVGAKEGNLTQEILEEAWLKAFKDRRAARAPVPRCLALHQPEDDEQAALQGQTPGLHAADAPAPRSRADRVASWVTPRLFPT